MIVAHQGALHEHRKSYVRIRKQNNSPILGTRRTVEVNDDLEPMVTRPADGIAEVGELSLHVRLAARDVPRPVADGNPDVVQAVRTRERCEGMRQMTVKLRRTQLRRCQRSLVP
jgi:hypothetical protein